MKTKRQKREEADIRNAEWRAKTFEQQLADLDYKFGPNKGAAKQRKKIAERIAERDAEHEDRGQGAVPKGKTRRNHKNSRKR